MSSAAFLPSPVILSMLSSEGSTRWERSCSATFSQRFDVSLQRLACRGRDNLRLAVGDSQARRIEHVGAGEVHQAEGSSPVRSSQANCECR